MIDERELGRMRKQHTILKKYLKDLEGEKRRHEARAHEGTLKYTAYVDEEIQNVTSKIKMIEETAGEQLYRLDPYASSLVNSANTAKVEVVVGGKKFLEERAKEKGMTPHELLRQEYQEELDNLLKETESKIEKDICGFTVLSIRTHNSGVWQFQIKDDEETELKVSVASMLQMIRDMRKYMRKSND